MIKKTVIIVGYSCNNKCKFCCSSHKRNIPDKTTRQIINEMIYSRQHGATYLEFIGGEETIRPDFPSLVNYAQGLKFSTIAMATNGRMLSYKSFAKKLIDSGITSIIFSIHGHTSELHDSLTGVKGSFRQMICGLQNIISLGFKDIASNTTIVNQNFRKLPEIGNFIKNLSIRNSEFIFVDPNQGSALAYFKELVPKISNAAPYIKNCLKIGRNNKLPHWHIRYIPLCLFPGLEEQISELDEQKKFISMHLGPDFTNFNVSFSRKTIGRIKPDKCLVCNKYDICEGLWVEYYKHYGDKELKPIGK